LLVIAISMVATCCPVAAQHDVVDSNGVMVITVDLDADTTPSLPPEPGYLELTFTSNGAYFCSVHMAPLRPDKVPIFYGFCIPSDVLYALAERTIFPNVNMDWLGGCTVVTLTNTRGTNTVTVFSSPREREVLYCPVCRDTREGWLTKYECQFGEASHNNGLDSYLRKAADALSENGQL